MNLKARKHMTTDFPENGQITDDAAPQQTEAVVAEEARLAKAESQKPTAFRIWHHLKTAPRLRDDVQGVLASLEPEARAWGEAQIDAELARLAKEKAEAAAAGFSMPTMREAAGKSSRPARGSAKRR